MSSLRWRPARARFACKVGTLVLVLAIGLVSAWPFLQNAGLPAGTDAELHVFRIAEVGYSIQAGDPYPRWAPDFFYGYGYPIFNYYAPLAYHLGYALTFGHPERAADAARLTFILAQVLGAAGAYALGSLFGRKSGGLLGALAFSLSPYIQIINPHVRGDLAESLALAFLPWSLWAWEQLWRTGRRRYISASVVATSAVFLSHNLTGLTAVALIGALSVWRWLVSRRSSNLGRAAAAGVVFVLLTAFFWLPFLFERSAVRLEVAGDGHYDFRNHFVLLRELLSPLLPIDWRSATMNVPMSAGPAVVALGALGAGILVWRRRFEEAGFYIIAAALCGFLILRTSQPLWELVAPMAYYQFPWRFLGPLATLLVPLVAGLGSLPGNSVIGARSSGRTGRLGEALTGAGVPLTASVLLIAALPGLYPTPWQPELGRIVPATIIEAELQGRWRGTTSTDDFVPATVDMTPGPTDSVLASYQAQQAPVDRVNRFTLPEGATVQTQPSVPWATHLDVSAPKAFLLRLYLFDFPGWRATVDGAPVPIEVAHPEGFITVRVPAGDHQVEVRFGTTPVRLWGWSLSGLGVALLIGTMIVTKRGPRSDADDRDARRRSARTALRERIAVMGVGTVLLAFGILKLALFDSAGWFWVESPVGEARIAGHSQMASLSEEVALLGYDLSSKSVNPGSVLEVTLYWQAQRPLTQTYQSFVHLMYPEGEIRAQSDHLNPGGFPTDLWPTDRYIRDAHRLVIPTDAPPGIYVLSVGMYTLADARRLPVSSAECGQRPDSVILCQTIVVRK